MYKRIALVFHIISFIYIHPYDIGMGTISVDLFLHFQPKTCGKSLKQSNLIKYID